MSTVRANKKTVIEILEKAQDLVRKEFGWTKNAYSSSMVIRKPNSAEVGCYDRRGVTIEEGELGLFQNLDMSSEATLGAGKRVQCYCAIGAVNEAVGPSGLRSERDEANRNRAIKELEKVLPKTYLTSDVCGGKPAVEEFNDLPTTTQRAVVNLFGRAIRSLKGG